MGDTISTPRVVVLICTYNYAEYLEEALESALKQIYPNFSIVIIDDCSTDNSWKIIYNKLFKTIPHESGTSNYDGIDYKYKIGKIGNIIVYGIQCESGPNGPSQARNIGIDATISDADFYCILDADDVMYRNKIGILVSHMIQSKQIGVAYGDYDTLNTETGNVIRTFKEPFDRNRLLQECIIHSGAMISKDALMTVKDNLGYYDKEMRTCEDYDLWIRITEHFMGYHVPEPLTLVRIQPKNSTLTVDKSIWEQNWQRIASKVRSRYG